MKYLVTKNQLHILNESIKNRLKSKSGNIEKDAIEFFTEKINNGDEVLNIGYDVFQKLPQDVKNKFWVNYLKLWSETDWDFNYENAQNEPFDTLIKNMLVELLKDKELLLKIADNFYWSDGSNGMINFSNLNHFITDLGHRIFAEHPYMIKINNLTEFKKQIEYNTSLDYSPFIKERYEDFEYDPNDNFSW